MAQEEVKKVYVGANQTFDSNPISAPVEVTTTGTVETATDGDYTIYTFKSDGTISFSKRTIVDVLVVGAGGSGTQNAFPPSYGNGGGGAGEVIYAQNQSFRGEYDITRGTGADGLAGTDSIVAQNSTNILVANGGGYNAGTADADGGCGAGGDNDGTGTQAPGTATPGTYKLFAGTITTYGENGGTATATQGGGGGGAGAVGGNAPKPSTNYGGVGGDGIANSITGISVTYGGGGGGVGGSITGNPNNGGAGGGGIGSSQTFFATAGTDYLGGGGGGNHASGFKRGGHGVVIFRVPNVA